MLRVSARNCNPARCVPALSKGWEGTIQLSGQSLDAVACCARVLLTCTLLAYHHRRPAYINGGNETIQPFETFINYGCNGWRNWNDIQCNWNSLSSIIDHWGDYGSSLQPFAGPGHWHDMDMLLIGNGCVSIEEEFTQMAIWASGRKSPLATKNLLEDTVEGGRRNPLVSSRCGSPLLLLTCALLMTSSHSEGHFGVAADHG